MPGVPKNIQNVVARSVKSKDSIPAGALLYIFP